MSNPCFNHALISVDDLHKFEPIGEGNFCVVFSAELNGKSVAMKVFEKHRVNHMKRQDEVLMEKHSLRKLRHNNVVGLIHTLADDERLYVITEKCDQELWNLCRKSGEPERRAFWFFNQVLDAVSYMHRCGIAHRDIKAENVLVDTQGLRVKLADLGSSKDFLDPTVKCSVTASFRRVFKHYVGTPNFMAPEAINNIENDFLSDLWSLGCFLYQILLGIPPFSASSEYFVFQRVFKYDLLFPQGISDQVKDLIKSLLQPERHARRGIHLIQSHDMLKHTPGLSLDYGYEEARCKILAQSDAFQELQSIRNEYNGYLIDRMLWVREWDLLSRAGTGSMAVDHLD